MTAELGRLSDSAARDPLAAAYVAYQSARVGYFAALAAAGLAASGVKSDTLLPPIETLLHETIRVFAQVRVAVRKGAVYASS